MSTTFADLWRNLDFRRLWLAQAVSAFGARITRDGLGYAAVLSLAATPAQAGLLSALANGPALVVGLVAGGFIDRHRKRRMMIWSDVARAAILAAVPVAALLHLLTMPQLYATAAFVGACSVLFEIADHAYLPSLVRREDLTAANASFSGVESVAEISGPALAGVLFQFLAGPYAIAVNAATYLVSAGFLGAIRKPEPPPAVAPPEHWASDLTAGFRIALAEPLVRPLLLMSMIQSLFGGIFGALYLIFGFRVLGLEPAAMGLTIGAGGVGALAGSLLAGRLSDGLGVGRAILVAYSLYGVALVLVPLAPARPAAGTAFLVAGQLLGDAAAVAGMVLAATLRQSVLPTETLGRVGGAFKATFGAMAVLGALAGGFAAGVIGIRTGLWVAALGVLAAPLILLASPLAKLKTMPSA